MQQVKRILYWIIGISIAAATIIVLLALFANYSTGTRAGTIIKMSKKGYVIKTNEGQLNTGEISDGIWEFSVRSAETEVLLDLQEALRGGYRVELHYNEKYVKIPFIGDTKYFVTKVDRTER